MPKNKKVQSWLNSALTGLGFALGVGKVIALILLWLIFLSPFLIVGSLFILR